MNKENCALKFVDEIILYYDAWSKKHKITPNFNNFNDNMIWYVFTVGSAFNINYNIVYF